MLPQSSPRRPNWPDKKTVVATSTRRAIIAGFSVIGLTVGGFGIWSTTVPIASAVVANGQVVVASKRKQIQHPTGGVIKKLLVDSGSVVAAGDVLIELDDSDAADRFTRARDAFYLTLASEARLEAEALEMKEPALSPELLKASETQPSVKAIVAGQKRLFEVRRVEVRGQLSIIQEQNEQLKDELNGANAERQSAEAQIGMTEKELAVVNDLFEQGYTTRTRVFSLRRETAQLIGASGRAKATIARIRSALIENELKLVQVKNQVQTQIQGELREAQAKVPNLREQYRAASLAYDRMTIRAPVAGTVMASRTITLGSVVKPGETVVEIVPSNDRLLVEVQLRPTDVDSVHIGLATEVRFTGLNQRVTVPLHGHVTNVSADAMQDPRSNASYFTADIDVSDSELHKLNGIPLQPGMPASVMIKTGERTAMAYLTQPLTDSINRAWRE